jgi:type I restriction enzyme S subunit
MSAAPHWELWKLAHAYRRIGSGTTPASGEERFYSEDDGVAWITTAELRETYVERTAQRVTSVALREHSALRVYAPGSVFIAMYGATIGRLGMNVMASACNQACCVFENSEVFENRFLYYWLWHRRNDLISMSVGVGQPNLSQQDLRSELALCPPLKTQSRITAFLDEKTAQIDALIAKKQTLLERLAEKRQAIITQAVTKGLNPAAPMKDSGVEWLGRIPAHWELKRLKYLTNSPMKYGANAPAEWDDPEWPRFIRITDVDHSGNLRSETFRSLPPEAAGPYMLAEGDILLARSGATVGKSFIYRKDWGSACFAGYLILARISQDHSADFVYQFLNSDAFWAWAHTSFIQSTIQNISAEKYSGLLVPCPPKQEQLEIANGVHLLNNHISNQELEVDKSLEKLREYRSAFISAAVTGQIEGLR